jgi:hypothetical protein
MNTTKPSRKYCRTGTLENSEKYNQNIHNYGHTPYERCDKYYNEFKGPSHHYCETGELELNEVFSPQIHKKGKNRCSEFYQKYNLQSLSIDQLKNTNIYNNIPRGQKFTIIRTGKEKTKSQLTKRDLITMLNDPLSSMIFRKRILKKVSPFAIS